MILSMPTNTGIRVTFPLDRGPLFSSPRLKKGVSKREIRVVLPSLIARRNGGVEEVFTVIDRNIGENRTRIEEEEFYPEYKIG